MEKTSPMMDQYARIKRAHRDAILFFRLGDFYEMFQQDAREASALLGLTLTQRNGVPMCGIPYHASQTYISRLLKSGKKVAICEQTSLPPAGKGLATREVIEVLTPGTVVDDDYLEGGRNNFAAAAARAGGMLSFSAMDLSTGDFLTTAFPAGKAVEFLKRELIRYAPRELLIQESLFEADADLAQLVGETKDLVLQRCPDWAFDKRAAFERLTRLFGTANLKAFGLEPDSPELLSAGALVEYVEEASRGRLAHVRAVKRYGRGDFMSMDEATIRNLELLRNLNDGSAKFSLLAVLDWTRTAMGARLLRRWLLEPLLDPAAIRSRLAAVRGLYRDQLGLNRVRESLSGVLDLSRLAARLALGKAHAKDLLAVKSSLQAALRVLADASAGQAGPAFPAEKLERLGAAVELLEKSIHESPSILLSEGSLIRAGWDAELDRLLDLREHGRETLDLYLEEERGRSKISNLKLRFNQIIGYYLEVTKSNLPAVPAHFIRRQSLVGGERFTTEKLLELAGELASASERIVELEKELFLKVRSQVERELDCILAVADRLAELDCLQSFAYAATVHGYHEPEIADEACLSIKDGRHPVVEAHLQAGAFVPNSLDMDSAGPLFALITGPNMAGKSTFLRQTALIAIMAQIGSFVPAEEARIGLVDSIFCRVGASDNLARGESTFLMEMNETAFILRNASPRSLVIMDEVGRGTGTKDGLALAWAISEYMLETLKARTLFATHFHELTALRHPGLFNLSMDIREDETGIVFLKKVRPGPSHNSYGLHVAQLAGLPREVVRRAAAILAGLEAAAAPGTAAGAPAGPGAAEPRPPAPAGQGQLFPPAEMLERELAGLDLDELTPMAALKLLERWQRELG